MNDKIDLGVLIFRKVAHCTHAMFIYVAGDDRCAASDRCQMSRLAARRGGNVQHAIALSDLKQVSDHLRSLILKINQTIPRQSPRNTSCSHEAPRILRNNRRDDLASCGT